MAVTIEGGVATNPGKLLNPDLVGPQATVSGVHTPYGTLTTISSWSSSSDDEVLVGREITGNVTITHNNVTLRDCHIKGRIACDTRSAMGTRSVNVEWCKVGDEGAGNTSNPGLRYGNITAYRSEFVGWIDHIQVYNGYLNAVSCWFRDLYDGSDDFFGGGNQSAHPDPIQFVMTSAINESDSTTVQQVIIQGCRFDSWPFDLDEVVGDNIGDTSDTHGRGTSGMFICNPKDPKHLNENEWFVVRDCYATGWYDKMFYFYGDGATSGPSNGVFVDNIFVRNSNGDWGAQNTFASVTSDSTIRWSRNYEADGTAIDLAAMYPSANVIAAGLSSSYPEYAEEQPSGPTFPNWEASPVPQDYSGRWRKSGSRWTKASR